MNPSVVFGSGWSLPDRVVSNADLAAALQTDAASILADTGVHERRWVAPGTGPSDLGAAASGQALGQAGLDPGDIDLIVFATMSPDMAFPGSGCFLQDKLGCEPIGALDVRAQCAGFIFAIATGDQFIRSGKAERVLVCGGDVHSAGLDRRPSGRRVTPRFGDGAGAVLLGKGSGGAGLLATALHSDPSGFRRFWCEYPASRHHPARFQREHYEAGLHYPVVDTDALAAQAEVTLADVAREAMTMAAVEPDAVRLAVMHYVDPRIAGQAADRLGLPSDRVVLPGAAIGHVSSGGIPIAVAQAIDAQRVGPGDVVMCAAFGAGLSWGAAVIRL